MKIALFGLGYVGTVTAACLAADGHDVVGIDAEWHKVDSLAAGMSPVGEPGLERMLERLSGRDGSMPRQTPIRRSTARTSR